MKKIVVLLAVTVLSTVIFAQSEKYTKVMESNIAMLDSAMVKGNLAELSNTFERIGDAEKTQWLPYYYASYCTVMSSYMEKDKSKTDGIADKGEELIKKAETLAGKENSEICVIKSMIASSHMMVDPQSRYQQYGAASASNITKAKNLDPTNPRPVYLEGQAKFYTPEAFGGGKAPAKELLTKALKMFDTFKPETSLYPAWGKASTMYFLTQCN
jgi:hypothetical protein